MSDPWWGRSRLTRGSLVLATSMLIPAVVSAQSLSQSVDGNQPRLIVTPSVRTVYDTNVLRLNESVEDAKDNVRITAGVDVIARRTFGRTAVNVSGSVGYDFNSRYGFLDRTRIEMGGGLRTPIGAICSVAVTARYDQFQFDLGDVDQVVGATTRQQYYDVVGSCNRSAGFSPLGGFTYRKRSSGVRALFNSTTVAGRVGVSYAKPSLGVVSLIGSRSRIRRPGIQDLLLSSDGTDISQLQVSLSRMIAPRLGFSVGVGYVRADPDRSTVERFSGASFNGSVTWRVVPRFVVDASAGRDVTNQNGINATYIVREDYQAGISWRLTQSSRVRLSATKVDRDFRGRDAALPLATILNNDTTDIVTASYSYDTRRTLRFTFAASQRWRDADVSRFDYKSTVLSATAGAKF